MRKLKLFFACLLMAVLSIGQMWGAEEEVYKTALFAADNNSAGNSSYSGTFTATNDGFTVSVANFNNNNNGWSGTIKCGSKSAASVASISTSAAIDKAVTKVVVTIGSVTTSNVNSIKLYRSTNGSTWTEESSFTVGTGAKEATVAAANQAANLYYKVAFDCKKGTGNGFVAISKVEYYVEKDESAPTLESIAISGDLSNKSYEEGQELDFSGLTVTGTYSDSNTDDVTGDVEWSFTPALTVGTTSYTVTATIGEISDSKVITGVTVTEHVVTPGEYTINLTNTLFGTAVNTNITSAINASQNDISLVVNGTGSTKPRTDATYIRFYGSSSLRLSVPSGYNITKIVISANESDYSAPSVSVGEFNTSTKTWTGKSNEVLWSFSAKSFIGQIKVTYEAIAPEVTVDPTSLSFDAKQNIAVDGKTFTLTGANLTSGLTLAASEGFTVSPTSLTAEAAMADGGAEVTVTPATPTATTTPVEGTVTISGGGLTDNVVVNLSMAVTPTYLVAIAVNDGDMGSATLNGGTASIYVTDDEEIALVATPESGHEFVNWTVSDENIILNNANAASTTAMAGAAGTITANFQAQACTGLAAPVLDEVTTTYQSAMIAWETVANADGYVLNIKKHEGNVPVVTDEVIAAPAVSFEKTGLAANTQYDYSVMAVGDGTSFCDESNLLLEGNFTTNDYPSVAVTYSENNNSVSGGSKKIMTPFALPTEVTNNISGKTFVGWTTKSDFEDGDESDEETYFAKGADFTITSNAAVTLYAVYATAGSGAGDTWVIDKDNFSTVGTGSGYAPYNGDHTEDGITYNTAQVMLQSSKVQFQKNAGTMYNKTAFDADIVSIAIDGIDANITVYEGSEEISTGGTAVTLNNGVYPFSAGKRYFRIKMGNATGAATSITVNLAGATSYSDYVISGSVALPVLAAPTFPVAEGVFYESTDITILAADGASIYYTTDGTTPSSTNGTLYEGAITLNAYGTYNIKAIAVQADHEDSEVAEATYYFGMTFASVSALYTYLSENSLTSMNNVKVTGLVSRITTAWDAQKGYLTYYISDNGVAENDLQMYHGAGAGADVLAVGDLVTVTGNYTLFQSTAREFAAGNTIVARTAAEVASVAIGGTAERTTYSPEDNVFSRAGLTATATYNTGYTKDVTALATWTNNLDNNTVAASGNVEVTATYEGESDTKEVAVTYTTKTLDHITLSYTSTTAYVGMALPTPTVTASYVEDIEDEDVTELVAAAEGFDTEKAYNGSVAGSYTINVSYTLGEVTKSAEYTVTVKSIYNPESDPYTVAEALDIIGANFNTTTASADSIVVAGIVSRLDGTYVNTYWISDDGNTNNELEVYSGKYLNKVAFTAANQLHVGDVVVVKGKVKTYQSTKEFDSNSRLISVLREPEFAIADIVAGDEFEANVSEDMTVVPTVNSGDAEFTLTSGNEAVVTIVNGKLHAEAEGDAVITATRAATNNANALNYKAKEITFNVHVIAERTRYSVTFDANGGEGTAPAAIANQLAGATVDMPAACPYNYEGYGFTGWKVINLSTEAEIEVENDQFEMPAANVKIQAQWAVVATCRISFQVNGAEVTHANAPQDADYNISQVGAAVEGFTFLGWSETEYADEVETLPTTISSYTPEAGENTKTLYGIYSRVEGAGETNHYVLDYEAEDLANNSSWGAYGTAYEHTAVDGGVWTIKAFKSSGMQINTTKSAYIKVPVCPANIKQIELTCNASAKKAVKFCATASDNADALANGSEATAQTLDLSGKSVTTGYIIPTGNCQITHIDVAYDAEKTYYTSSPVAKVTITFDANGGNGGCTKAIINKGSELTICAEAPTKSHSEFDGWKNGDDVYVAGQAYTFNANITLTAQWKDAATYDVTFDKNGGTGTAETIEDQYAGDEITLPAALTRDQYTFQGWKYGSKLYKAGAQFTMPAEAVEFVAQWRKASVPVDKMSMVTSASALSNGMQIALGYSAGETFAMAGDLGSNKYMASVIDGVSLSDGVATYTEDVVVMTLEQVENGWKITKDGTNYLNETSVKNLAWTTKENATTWSISFSGNNVKISSANGTMKFNAQDPRFTTYASGQKDIQLFGKAVVVTENISTEDTTKISDLGYTEGENIIASGANVTLKIDEPTNAQSITAKNGATVVIKQETTAQNVVVEEGSKIVAEAATTTPTVYFSTTMGAADSNGDFHSTTTELGSVTNITLATGGEIIYDLTLGTNKDGVQADPNQWHAFSLPFAVDAINGVYDAETGAKLTNEENYAIMSYHGDIRAQGKYGWKKYRGIMQPGVFYLMTVDGNTRTFRFKAAKTGVMTQINSMSPQAYDGNGADSDKGWNGFGNPRWIGGTFAYNAQYLDPYSYEYITITPGTRIPVGLPFFYKTDLENTPITVKMDEVGTTYGAPARYRAYEIKNVAVRFGNEVFKDKLYISASEDALNEYEQNKDLVRMIMSNTPKVAQIFGNAYGMKLSMVNAQMVNDQAEYSLTLYAPEAGEYTISAPAMEDADLYLTKDGAIIWNLSTSEYTTDFTKGNNEGYGLMLIKKAPGAATGTENIEAAEAGAQKVVINNNVYILRNEQMYDVTGKAVK